MKELKRFNIYFGGRYYTGIDTCANNVLRRAKRFERSGWNAKHDGKEVFEVVAILKPSDYGKGMEV